MPFRPNLNGMEGQRTVKPEVTRVLLVIGTLFCKGWRCRVLDFGRGFDLARQRVQVLVPLLRTGGPAVPRL